MQPSAAHSSNTSTGRRSSQAWICAVCVVAAEVGSRLHLDPLAAAVFWLAGWLPGSYGLAFSGLMLVGLLAAMGMRILLLLAIGWVVVVVLRQFIG